MSNGGSWIAWPTLGKRTRRDMTRTKYLAMKHRAWWWLLWGATASGADELLKFLWTGGET